jgi:hypothetical protein
MHPLQLTVTRERFNALAALPAPAYLIGVDTRVECSYIVAANRQVNADVPSILRAYNLKDDGIKIALYQEVVQFWRRNRRSLRNSRFAHV